MPFGNIAVLWDIVRRIGEFCLKGNYVLKWTCFACFLVLNVLPEQFKCHFDSHYCQTYLPIMPDSAKFYC